MTRCSKVRPWFRRIAVLLLLVLSAAGCCTQRLREHAYAPRVDRFKPSAVYQDANTGSIALEGALHKNLPQEQAWWPDSDHKHTVPSGYLILPRFRRSEEILSNNELWLTYTDVLWPTGIVATLQDHLPRDYAKIR
jgi:hypothetical protein